MDTQSTYKEGQLLLAKFAVDQGQIQAPKHAATVYAVPETTLRRRLTGISSRRDCIPNSKKLTLLEESVIIQHILDLDSRGFLPRLAAVEDMANKLLTARGKDKVGKNWASNFVRRTPELKTRFNHKYDYQRALNENPKVIQQWFEHV